MLVWPELSETVGLQVVRLSQYKVIGKASALQQLGCADPFQTCKRAVDVSGYLSSEI